MGKENKALEKVLKEFTISMPTIITIMSTWPLGEPSSVLGGNPKPWTPESLAKKANVDIDIAAIIVTLLDPRFTEMLYVQLRRGVFVGLQYNSETKNIAIGEMTPQGEMNKEAN